MSFDIDRSLTLGKKTSGVTSCNTVTSKELRGERYGNPDFRGSQPRTAKFAESREVF